MEVDHPAVPAYPPTVVPSPVGTPLIPPPIPRSSLPLSKPHLPPRPPHLFCAIPLMALLPQDLRSDWSLVSAIVPRAMPRLIARVVPKHWTGIGMSVFLHLASNTSAMPVMENAQLNGNQEHRAPYPQNGNDRNYEIPKSHHSQKTRIRVACVGAGPTGKSAHRFPFNHQKWTHTLKYCRTRPGLQDGTSNGTRHLGLDPV
jgi:hypothetical protein